MALFNTSFLTLRVQTNCMRRFCIYVLQFRVSDLLCCLGLSPTTPLGLWVFLWYPHVVLLRPNFCVAEKIDIAGAALDKVVVCDWSIPTPCASDWNTLVSSLWFNFSKSPDNRRMDWSSSRFKRVADKGGDVPTMFVTCLWNSCNCVLGAAVTCTAWDGRLVPCVPPGNAWIRICIRNSLR